jgi:hypothetical protein
VPNVVIPPGDWDIMAWAFLDGWPTFLQVYLDPPPAGISNNMMGINASSAVSGEGAGYLTVNTPRARASFSQPSLIPFLMVVNQYGSPIAGTWSFILSARRVR